jgi:hypothetical protein
VPSVLPELEMRATELSMRTLQNVLAMNDRTGFMEIFSRVLFEIMISKLLTTERVSWQLAEIDVKKRTKNDWMPFSVYLAGGVDRRNLDQPGKGPGLYRSLQLNTLYYPKEENSPFVEMFFTTVEGGPIYCLQVTREKRARTIEFSAYRSFMKQLGVPWTEAHKIHYIYCPGPDLADTALPKLEAVPDPDRAPPEGSTEFKALKMYILKIPAGYSHSF